TIAAVPMKTIGPIKIIGPELVGDIIVPLATYESPLWPSTNRGAKVSQLTEGIRVVILQDCMTRSVLMEAPDAAFAQHVIHDLQRHRQTLEQVVKSTSRFADLQDWHTQVVGNLLYLRFSLNTGDAAGHNMVTQAADVLLQHLLQQYPQLQY